MYRIEIVYTNMILIFFCRILFPLYNNKPDKTPEKTQRKKHDNNKMMSLFKDFHYISIFGKIEIKQVFFVTILI